MVAMVQLGYLDVEVAGAGFLGSGWPAARCLVDQGCCGERLEVRAKKVEREGLSVWTGAPDECDGARAESRPGVSSSARDDDIAALCV